MADGYRYLQQSVGNPVYSQYSSTSSVANGILLNSLLTHFAAEPTSPSPSKSPSKSKTQSFGPNPPGPDAQSMYGQGHQQGHNSRLNGAPAGQRGLGPILYNHQQQQASYQHQVHAQHHQASHADNNAHGVQSNVIGHHPNYSNNVLSNSSPFSGNNLQNGHSGIGTRGGQSQPINEHWAEQLRMRKEAERAHATMTEAHQPHYWARLKAPENKGLFNAQGPGGTSAPSSGVEDDRRRPWAMDKSPKRQDWHNLDMSGQGLRSLSSALFCYDFLQELYIASNRLTFLPSGIGQLRQLRLLEASFNQISELPPELGMCTSLKQLYLFENNIRELPHELGSLYLLEMLGIDGNPLVSNLKEEIMERGTKSLISYLRETAPVPPAPAPRVPIVIEQDISPQLERVKVFTWNILCDKYATTQVYGYTPAGALSWDYRKQIIMDEIVQRDADILCLQEMATDVYRDFFTPELSAHDYRGIHWPRPKAKTMSERDAAGVDGCAVFWKQSKFILLDKQLIDYATIAINRPDMKSQHDIFNRVMPKDNIGIICFFESRATGARMIVACTHLAWEPTLADVKLVQTAILMENITKMAEKYARWPALKDKKNMQVPRFTEEGEDGQEMLRMKELPDPAPSQDYRNNTDIPLFVCGDYNSTAESSVYEFLSKGRVAPDHPELAPYQYGSFTRDGIEHPFSLRSAYANLNGGADELTFTNYVPGFAEMIDYIWYSTNTLDVISLLGPPDREYLKRVPGFPHYHFPADHIQLLAEFKIKPRKDKKLLSEQDFASSGGDRRG